MDGERGREEEEDAEREGGMKGGMGVWREGGRGGLSPPAPCDALSSPGSPVPPRRGASPGPPEQRPRGR